MLFVEIRGFVRETYATMMGEVNGLGFSPS